MFINSDFEGVSSTMITQLLRGKIYVAIDFFLGSNSYSEEQVDAINDLINTVLKMVVAWQKKLITLLPFVIIFIN